MKWENSRLSGLRRTRAKDTIYSNRTGNKEAVKETKQLIRPYLPQLDEEFAGFCDEMQLDERYLTFFYSSHLQPGCSHCVRQGNMAAGQQTVMLRNYDFSPIF